LDNTEDFFKNYKGKYSQYWIERWGLIPELPTSFDNANSMYELVAWLQRAFKNLLDDFQQLESEFEDFKNALIDLLEYLIPELIRRYHDSAEFRAIFIIMLQDILAGEERTWLKDLLKELLEVDMREWIEAYLKELYGLELKEFFMEVTNARGNFPYLGNRLDDIATSLSDKANKTWIENQLTNIITSKPTAALANFAEIQNTYPDGVNGIVVARDSGKWYYWSDSSNTWTEGGIYQSRMLGENEVTADNIDFVHGIKQMLTRKINGGESTI